MTDSVLHTTLHGWHVAQGAKMVPFAGYDMPVQYPTGIIAEHNHTRNIAGLFDVSHMGQLVIRGADAVKKFEHCVPSNVHDLKPGAMRYTLLLNDWGGALDDMIMVRPEIGDDLWLIVNAGCKDKDLLILQKYLGDESVEMVQRDLIALQGPKAKNVLQHYVSDLDRLGFMQARWTTIESMAVVLMRSGYTGEDGFEISVSRSECEKLVQLLMRHEEVKPVGLGARDTLRLEAGLCLYGHELNEKISPIEAGLNWVISKMKLSQGEFKGAAIVEALLLNKPERVRVGLIIDDRAPAREGTEIHDLKKRLIGHITSGGFSPTLNQPVAMGYVDRHVSIPGSKLHVIVRGREIAAHVATLPFVPHRYHQKNKL